MFFNVLWNALKIWQIAPPQAVKDRQPDATCNLIIDNRKPVNNIFGVIFYLRKHKATNDYKTPIYSKQG
jgi:hypothetical protein